jgi:AraC-like DNA-binding protein
MLHSVPLFAPANVEGGIWFSDPVKNRETLLSARELTPLERARARTLARHTHPEIELNLVVRGHAALRCDDRRIELRCGTLLFIPPGIPHLLDAPAAELRVWVINLRLQSLAKVISEEPFERLLSPHGLGLQARQLPLPALRKLSGLFAEVFALRQRRWQTFNLGLSYAVANAFDEMQECVGPLGEVHPAVERAACLLRDTQTTLDLHQLAKLSGLSKDHLSRTFSAQMGMSIPEFRAQAKMERFFELFGEGQRHGLMRAALLAGFGSYAQFQRAFKRHTGLAPAAYLRARRAASQAT